MTGAPSPRIAPFAAWTGTELIVWAGATADPAMPSDGARYDPATDTWRAMATDGATTGRSQGGAAWTGSELFAWGGYDARGVEQATGALYDPAIDRWRPVPMTDAPSARAEFTTVWTGSEVIVWGGHRSDFTVRPTLIERTDTGAAFDPRRYAWRAVESLGAPSARDRHAGVWTGSEMLVWGGLSGTGPASSGGRFQPPP